MTLVNFISIAVTILIAITIFILTMYFRRKYKNLDGFGGFLPSDKKESEDR